MKKIFLLISILIMPTNLQAECLPKPNIPKIISISEVDFQNPDQDFVEIFISHPEITNSKDIELIVDGKNIFQTDKLEKYTNIQTDLTATTEQILLKYQGRYIDGICWQNNSPANSELQDLDEYHSLQLTPCFHTTEVQKPLHLARQNLYPTYQKSDWQLTGHKTPSSENNFQTNPPKAKIQIQSGKTQSNSPISLNLDGSSSIDPHNLNLTYDWDFGNGEISDKSNPNSVEYNTPGIYTIQLTVTNSLGLKDTTFLSINYLQINTENTPNPEGNTDSENNPEQEDEKEAPAQNEEISTEDEKTPAHDTDNLENTHPQTNYQDYQIQITSFLANPEGIDANNEWIEISNISQESIDITNWQIDDIIGQSKPYRLPEQTIINAQSSIKIYNHQSKVNLNNSEDSVRLITPNNEEFSSFTYQNAESGIIINTNQPKETENQNQDSNPPNLQPQTFPPLSITEIFPNPEGSDFGNEWIEIHNPNPQIVTTHNWKLIINDKTQQLPNLDLQPNSYTQININGLTNSATTISLQNPNFQDNSSVTYTKSLEQQSFQLTNSDWIWSEFLTPNKSNIKIIEQQSQITNIDKILQILALQNGISINYQNQQIPPINTQVLVSYIQNSDSNQLIDIQILEENQNSQPIKSNTQSPLSNLNYEASQKPSSGVSWQTQLATYSAISLAGVTFRKPISRFIKTKISV